MIKRSLLLFFVACLFGACNNKLPLKNGSLTGYCGYEIINSDKGLLCFNSDSTFTRQGDMYIINSGSYTIQSDTLSIAYYCEPCKSKSGSCCGEQKYILTSGNALKIVQWKDASGSIQSIPKGYKRIELFKK